MWASAWVQILDLITLAFGPWASYLALWTSFSKSELNNRLFLTRCHEKRVEHEHQVPRRVSCRQTCPPDGKRSSLRAGISAAFSPPHPMTVRMRLHGSYLEDKLGAGRHHLLLHSPTATRGPPREALALSHLQGFLSPPALSIPSFIKEGG